MLALLARAVLVTLLAAVISGLPMATLLTWGMEPGLRLFAAARLFLVAIIGSFLIGLPISLATYGLLNSNQQCGVWTLVVIGNLAAIALALLAGSAAGIFGLVFYGIPILIAANVFAVAGWFIVMKPTRANI